MLDAIIFVSCVCAGIRDCLCVRLRVYDVHLCVCACFYVTKKKIKMCVSACVFVCVCTCVCWCEYVREPICVQFL